MRALPVIRPATEADRPAIIDVLARAFIDDPALAWLFPDAARRLEKLERFFRLTTSTDMRFDSAQLALGSDGEVRGGTGPGAGWSVAEGWAGTRGR